MCVGTSLFSSAMQYGEIGAVLYSFIWDLKVWRSDPSLATHCYLWYPNSTKSLSLCNSLPLIPHHWNTESLAEDVLVLFGAVRSKYETVKSLVTKKETRLLSRSKSEIPFYFLGISARNDPKNAFNSNDTNDLAITYAISRVQLSFVTNEFRVTINSRNKIWTLNLRDT